MITKYICSYCEEEFDNFEQCRVHEDKCANQLNELLIFTISRGWIDGRTFLEDNISFDNILIIKNTSYCSLYALAAIMEKKNYVSPLKASLDDAFYGFYYWSDFAQTWGFTKKWNDTLTRIVNTGTDIEDE